MSAKAIGKTLPFGYRGAVTRQPDTLIQPYTNVGEDAISYGAPVVYDNGGVRKIKTGDTADSIIGIAVRRIGQPYADDASGWYYKTGDVVDVLVRGSIAVELKATTGIAARGKVYADASDGELTSVASGNIALPNTVFATGSVDSNNIAEVTVLTRNI